MPAAVDHAGRLPLNRNGKVDRRALPDAGHRPPTPTTSHPAPSWRRRWPASGRELLGVPKVGVDDNFFELGGDSILSIRLVSRLLADCGLSISPRALFTHPTVAGLAGALGATATDQSRSRQGTCRCRSRSPSSGCGSWTSFEPGGGEYVTSAGGRLHGPAGRRPRCADAFTELVARHEALRTTFDGDAGVQIVHPPHGRVPCRPARCRPSGKSTGRVCADGSAPFDLRRGPLIRPRLVRLRPTTSTCSRWRSHHIVTDGWSNGVIADEVVAPLPAARDGAGDLPRCRSSTRTSPPGSASCCRASGRPARRTGADHWPTCRPLDLPTDRPRPGGPHHDRRRARGRCPADGSRR